MKTNREYGQGAVGYAATLFFLGFIALAIFILLMPTMQSAFQSIPAPIAAPQVQTLDDAAITSIAANDCATLPSSHAAIAHGAAAYQAINACNSNGAKTMTHVNPATGRKMTGCMLDGKIYVVVDDKDGQNITAYQKDEFHFWDELVRYFRFSGYTR